MRRKIISYKLVSALKEKYSRAVWQVYFWLGFKSSFKPVFTRVTPGFCSSLVVYTVKGKLDLGKETIYIILRFSFPSFSSPGLEYISMLSILVCWYKAS